MKKLIEYHIRHNSTLVNENIVIKNSKSLMSPRRLDLGFKLFYLNNKDKLSELSNNLYRKTIEIITNFSFREFGNNNKTNYTSFLNQFKEIEESIKSKGFDSNESLIPVSVDNIILDGSHRLSSCIKNNQKVPTLQYNSKSPNYNWTFFRDRGMAPIRLRLE